MTGVFRAMIAHDDKPVIGIRRDMLGVREDGSDIPIRKDRTVAPETGGLSIGPEWRKLPEHTVPRRLRDKFPRARGNNNRSCFRLEDAEFSDGPVSSSLILNTDSPTHGTIQPDQVMDINDYQKELANTISRWVIDEV